LTVAGLRLSLQFALMDTWEPASTVPGLTVTQTPAEFAAASVHAAPLHMTAAVASSTPANRMKLRSWRGTVPIVHRRRGEFRLY